MFVLVQVRDSISLRPQDFDKDRLLALTNEVHRKYANRVISGVGLCICLHEFGQIGDAYVYPGDGAAHVVVTMRLLVMRPFEGEVIEGTVNEMHAGGLNLTLNQVFINAYVPSYCMFGNTRFDADEKVWLWEYTNDEGEVTQTLRLQTGRRARVRVRTVSYQQVNHTKQGEAMKAAAAAAASSGASQAQAQARQQQLAAQAQQRGTGATGAVAGGTSDAAAGADEADPTKRAVMMVECSMDEDGLGLLEWWPPEEEAGGA